MDFGMQVIQSEFAVKQDGTIPKEIQVSRGGFWARLFDPDPTFPLWQKTKTVVIQVPDWKPIMLRMMDKIIVHPSLMTPLMEAIKRENTSSSSSVFSWK